jgi:hypothetical protein
VAALSIDSNDLPAANQSGVKQAVNSEVKREPAAPSQPDTSSPSQPDTSFLNRPKIIFDPIVSGIDSRGRAVLRPDVQVADDLGMPDTGSPINQATYVIQDDLPPPAAPYPTETEYPTNEDWTTPVVVGDCEPHDGNGYGMNGHWQGLHRHMNGCGGCGGCASGVGAEYVMHAPFFVDTTQPFNNCYVRGDAAADWDFPDRAEYFWARTPGGRGPADPGLSNAVPPVPLNRGETSVDYQDVVFYIEKGAERFSIGTKIPIRAVDPDIRLNTAGLADMEVISKVVLIDGKCWQLSHIFSTHLPTGSAKRGTGNGHVSLEPGVAVRYKWSDLTYLHGDLTYLFPIAADPDWSGQMLNHGLAISHVWIDTDTYAIIPTLELDAWTVLDGRQTLPGFALNPVTLQRFDEIDTVSMVNIYPGLRWVCDKGCDCGVKEFGISTGVCVTEDSWYEEILRVEFRWSR